MNHRFVVRIAIPVCLLLSVASDGRAAARQENLDIADRVAAQRALDSVAHRHQVGAKRSFEAAAPDAVLERKVRTYLKKSVALQRYWSTPITSGMLDAEIDRLARSTRDAGRLLEMYAALGNDPLLVRECLARPLLVDRLTRSFFENDATIQPAAALQGEAPRRGWDSWWSEVEGTLDETSVRVAPAPARPLSLPQAAAAAHGCSPGDAWDNKSLDDPPDARADHVAVWTGSEMIIWGGKDPTRRFTTGALYNPATDTWRQMTPTGAPAPNVKTGADQGFWTGSEMLVWAGSARGGGRYNPASDHWQPMGTTGAPAGPGVQAWLGSLLFVYDAAGPAAAVYDPAADSWSARSTTGAPSQATLAIRAGQYVVTFANGAAMARYDTAANAWLPVSAAAPNTGLPQFATGMGTEVFVSRGPVSYRYTPATDTWMPAAGAPNPVWSGPTLASRQIFTGTELLVWGGQGASSSSYLGGPYRYDPASDTWSVSAVPNGLEPRGNHTLVWTGTTMIAWGGKRRDPYFYTGGRYNPSTDTWTPVSVGQSIGNAGRHHAVWTGSEMLTWGGDGEAFSSSAAKGARYDPATDAWSQIPDPYPLSVPQGTAISTFWTGDEMLVWGGTSGGGYDPVADSWRPIAQANAPVTPGGHAAVWTGEVMLVWGGLDLAAHLGASGGEYDPVADAWTAIPSAGAPTSRIDHSAVWTGEEMVVWGGIAQISPTDSAVTNTGGRYNPATRTWRPTSIIGAPPAQGRSSVVWTGTEMIVRGGPGGRYEPVSDTWRGIAAGDPGGTTAVWTGKQMLVWGSSNPSTIFENGISWPMSSEGFGGRYDPVADAWSPLSREKAPTTRSLHTAVWTGDRMLVWGGGAAQTLVMRNGGAYVADAENRAPIAVASAAPRIECTSPAGARVTLDGTGSSDADAVEGSDPEIVSYEWIEGLGSGSPTLLGTGATLDADLGLGEHSISLRVTDACGATSVATADVVVEDTVAPSLQLTADPLILWPADRRMKTVSVQGTVSDTCDAAPAVTLTGLTSNEAGAADVSGADIGTADFSVLLRATRNGGGTGRVYRITYQALDAAGNTVERVVEVTVPHDRRGGAGASSNVRPEPVRGGAMPAAGKGH